MTNSSVLYFAYSGSVYRLLFISDQYPLHIITLYLYINDIGIPSRNVLINDISSPGFWIMHHPKSNL